ILEGAKEITVPGFRKGKAPISLVKKLHGDAIKIKSLDKIADEKFWKEVENQKLKVINEPVITHLDITEDEALDFKVKFETYPEIELNDYSEIRVDKVQYQISEEMVDEEINRILFSKRKSEPVDKVEDYLTIVELEITKLDVSGLHLVGEKPEKLKLYLNAPDANKDLASALMSRKKDEEFTYVHHVEHEHKDSLVEHKHQDEKYLIKVLNIEKVIIPELTNDLCSEITKGEAKTIDEFRQKVRERIQKEWDKLSEQVLENSIITELIHKNDFAAPKSFLDKTLDMFIEEEKSKYQNKNLPYDFDIQQFKESKLNEAATTVKWLILRDTLLKKENIDVTESELEQIAEAESKKTGISKEKMLNYIKSSNQVLGNLKTNKAINFLKEKIHINIINKAL
ncbi:MAG: trigger factor, partial [Ignavibacteria bacterium]|nr:trigger factor [Ignavibacteria bacterium]